VGERRIGKVSSSQFLNEHVPFSTVVLPVVPVMQRRRQVMFVSSILDDCAGPVKRRAGRENKGKIRILGLWRIA
jgi:hypothetical protein